MCDWIVIVVCVCVCVCVVPVLTSNTKYVLHLLHSCQLLDTKCRDNPARKLA